MSSAVNQYAGHGMLYLPRTDFDFLFCPSRSAIEVRPASTRERHSSLRLAMDDNSAKLEPQKGAGSQSNEPADGNVPVLMQRVPSSGIDMSAFSFARPANTRKPFSLRGPVNPPNLNSAFVGEAGQFNTRKGDEYGSETVETETQYDL